MQPENDSGDAKDRQTADFLRRKVVENVLRVYLDPLFMKNIYGTVSEGKHNSVIMSNDGGMMLRDITALPSIIHS